MSIPQFSTFLPGYMLSQLINIIYLIGFFVTGTQEFFSVVMRQQLEKREFCLCHGPWHLKKKTQTKQCYFYDFELWVTFLILNYML